MAVVLNTLKSAVQSAYTFMGTIDSGEQPQNFEKVDTTCNTSNSMVQLIECQNNDTTSINGINQIPDPITKDIKDNLKDVAVDQMVPTKEGNLLDDAQSKKRKLDDANEPNTKRAKNSELSLEDLENTGRGKRIKKIKKNFFSDEFHDSDQLKDLPLKRPDRRFVGDIEDKEYKPPFKVSKPENGMNNTPVTPIQKDTSSSGYDYLRSLIKPDLKKKIEKDENATNEEDDVEGLTIIDITNISSGDEDDEASSTPDQQIDLPKVADKSNHESLVVVNTTPNIMNKSAPVDILQIVQTAQTCNPQNLNSTTQPSQRPSNVTEVSNVALPSSNSVSDEQNCQRNSSYLVNVSLNSNLQIDVDQVKNLSAIEMEKNPVTSSKPPKKSSKKSSKKPKKKKTWNDFDLSEELKQVNKLKSKISKKHDKAPDGCKQLGPYIQCRGPKDSLSLCRIVNVKDQDTEHGTSNPAKYSMLPSESCCSHVSSRMNENVPWKCILCPFGSSYMDLGDLFGPYFPQQPSQSSMTTNDESSKSINGQVRNSSKPEMPPGILSSGLPSEIWVHCDCAIWTSGVFVSGGRLKGLEEAALAAQQYVCFSCDQSGATLGCLVKGCQQNYHYICACRAGCTFQVENFSILCPKHKNYRINKPIPITEQVDGQPMVS